MSSSRDQGSKRPGRRCLAPLGGQHGPGRYVVIELARAPYSVAKLWNEDDLARGSARFKCTMCGTGLGEFEAGANANVEFPLGY